MRQEHDNINDLNYLLTIRDLFPWIIGFLAIPQRAPIALAAKAYYKATTDHSINKLQQNGIIPLMTHSSLEQDHVFFEQEYPEAAALQYLSKSQESKKVAQSNLLKDIAINTAMKHTATAMVLLNRSTAFLLSPAQRLTILLCHTKICEQSTLHCLIPSAIDEKTVLTALKDLSNLTSQLVVFSDSAECKKEYKDAYLLRYKTHPTQDCYALTYHTATGTKHDIAIKNSAKFIKDLKQILIADCESWDYQKKPIRSLSLTIADTKRLFSSTKNSYAILLQNTAAQNLLKLPSLTKHLRVTTWQQIATSIRLQPDTISQITKVTQINLQDLKPTSSSNCVFM